MNCANDDETLLLQFNNILNIVGNKLQKIIGFAHPDLINIKGGPVHLFIDCTCKCVPKEYSQCLVIMILVITIHLNHTNHAKQIKSIYLMLYSFN